MKHTIINQLANRIMSEINLADSSLFYGKAGMILSLAHYHSYCTGNNVKNQIEKTIKQGIDSILDDIENTPLDGSLMVGITGISYALRTCYELGLAKDMDNDWFEPLDEIIHQSLEKYLQLKEYDLLRGATGIVVYLQDKSVNGTYIEKYINSLFDNAVWESKDKCKWIFYSYNEEAIKMEYRDDIINLGLAHGMASIVSVLSGLYKRGYLQEKCEIMIIGAINYLKSVQNPNSINQFCGIVYEKKAKQSSSKLGWCYGDISVGLAIVKAGVNCNKNHLIDYGNQICLKSSERNIENAGLEEHGICHGYLGTSHIYNRLFAATKQQKYLQSKNYWYNVAFEKRDFDIDLLGFFQTEVIEKKSIKKYTGLGVLQGLSGILLCLLSHEEIKYSWDSIFLTDF